jgi:hydrogenase nickel incorporation protein HypA/HybF
MHEFSIIQNIIDIVKDSASAHGITKVSAVEVEVGQASGVIREAMEFAWEAATNGTLLGHAELKIKEIPLLVRCGICSRKYSPCEIYEACPGCGEINPEIITGRELRVVCIET